MNQQAKASEITSSFQTAPLALANKLAKWLPFVRKRLDQSAKKYSLIARTQYEAGDEESAIESYKKALAYSPQDVSILNDLGQLCYENDRLDEAEGFYRRVLEEDYFNERALKGLGFTLHWRGNLEEARYIYLRFLDANRGDYEVLLNLSALFLDSEEYERTIEYSKRAAEADPKMAAPHQNLAHAYFNQGKFPEAEVSVRRALDLEADEESFRLLGLVLETQERTDEALESYQRAVKTNPNAGYALLDIAHLYDKMGKYKEYLDSTLKAIEQLKNQDDEDGLASAYWDLGWAYCQLGEWENSIEASRKAVEMDPQLAPPRFNLGLALLHTGQPDAARKEYLLAIENSKPSDLKNDAIDDLVAALSKKPDLMGAREILDTLLAKYATFEKQLTVRRT